MTRTFEAEESTKGAVRCVELDVVGETLDGVLDDVHVLRNEQNVERF